MAWVQLFLLCPATVPSRGRKVHVLEERWRIPPFPALKQLSVTETDTVKFSLGKASWSAGGDWRAPRASSALPLFCWLGLHSFLPVSWVNNPNPLLSVQVGFVSYFWTFPFFFMPPFDTGWPAADAVFLVRGNRWFVWIILIQHHASKIKK